MTSRRDGSLVATLLLAVANVLIPIAVLTFATGFFPYKPLLPGFARYEALPKHRNPPVAPFDKLIFMVVDALRSDFVYTANSGFQYTQSLIRDGAAIPFTSHATSPTVTMPRLKAITTGSMPSFLDVILNLNEGDESSTLASQDSWLAQMKTKGTGNLVMYGDDTWLKLFPDTFDRADGTTSFFVADFTEVDNNVTRHLESELKRDDWSTVVLHYLGLDHIGHKGGPRSANMIPKQREMDGIVETIFSALESEKHLRSTLLVMCGDHGMNDAGNHGGSSAGETSPALLFMSPKLRSLRKSSNSPLAETDDFKYYSVVEQSDIVPTLGALLGIPVPKNNLGVLIPDFLPYWSNRSDQVQLLLRNARQIQDIVIAAFGPSLFQEKASAGACTEGQTDIEDLACEWHKIFSEQQVVTDSLGTEHAWTCSTIKWLRKAQSLMSRMASNYDMFRLLLGQICGALAVLCALRAVHMLVADKISSFLPFTAMTVGYGIMMFASSYVEEEHHFWYWGTSAWLGLQGLKGFNGKPASRSRHIWATLCALAATRVIGSWNQTGQKFAGNPDLVKLYLHTNPAVLWTLVSATYLWIHRKLVCGFDGLPAAVNISATTGVVLTAYTFKLAFTNEDAPELMVGFAKTVLDLTNGATLVHRAQAVFMGLALTSALFFYLIFTKRQRSVNASTVETLHHLYTLLALTQSRATNIPLFLLMNAQRHFLGSQDFTLTEVTTSSILLQHGSFFAFGGSNAISSVDLSSAYNGIADYNVALVGLLTFVSNWAAPIWWVSATVLLLLRKRKAGGENAVLTRYVAVHTAFVACAITAVMAACTLLRTHLFIWTVFSPKYLYTMAWSLGQHLAVNVGVAAVLFCLGTV